MIFIPQAITAFTYDNIQSAVLLWNEATTYAVGDLARVGSWQYKSVISSNIDKYPLDNLNIYWYDRWAPANDYAMLDLFPATRTEWTAEGIVEFTRGTKDSIGIGDFKATQITIEYLDALSGVVSGLTIATSVDLDSIITAGLIYVDEKRFDFEATPKTFTASKDTYVDIDDDGAPVYTEVTLGAGAPVITSPNERIAKVVTDADNITSVEDLRTIIDPVLDTQTFTFSSNGDVWDEWTYGYGGFTDSVSETVYTPLLRKGTYVRVTFSADGDSTYCGFMVAGLASFMGDTLDKVSFPDKRIGSKKLSVADFRTSVVKATLMRKTAEAKALIDESVLFVIDESTDSSHSNMIILGQIKKVDGTGEASSKNYMTWQIEQNIEE